MRTLEAKNSYLKKWRNDNPDKMRAANKRKYAKDKKDHPERLEAKKLKQREWYKNNANKHTTYKYNWAKNKLREIKELIYDKLGHICKNCGFADKRALCIDHKNGGGVAELKKLSVFQYYKKVLEDVTDMYQILCHNCNWIKRSENNEVRKQIKKIQL